MKHALIIIVPMISFLLATDIYTPSMPELERHFGASSDMVQKTMSYFLCGAVLACAIAGVFADQWGRKRLMLGGLLLASVGSIFTIFCPTLDWLIWGRFLQGLGSGVLPVIGFAAIQELYPPEKTPAILGTLGILVSSIPSVAPLLGGIISTAYGWPMVFVVLFWLFILSFGVVWFFLPPSLNTRAHASGSEILRSYKTILTHRTFLAFALLSPLFNSAHWFYLTFLPFYMQDFIGLSPTFYGFIVGLIIVWFGIGSYLGSKLIERFGVHTTTMVGLYAGLIASLILWGTAWFWPKSILLICGSLSLFLAGCGVLFPGSVTSSLNLFPSAKSRASSVRSLFVTGLSYVGSYSAEWANESDLSGLALYVLVCTGLAFGAYTLRARPNSGDRHS